jgi:hypothetical protein
VARFRHNKFEGKRQSSLLAKLRASRKPSLLLCRLSCVQLSKGYSRFLYMTNPGEIDSVSKHGQCSLATDFPQDSAGAINAEVSTLRAEQISKAGNKVGRYWL